MARPSKLTPALADAICDALRDGASWAAAAASVGIDETTLHRWRKRGEAAKSGRYRQFCQSATRAQDEGEARAARAVDMDSAMVRKLRRRGHVVVRRIGEGPPRRSPAGATASGLAGELRRFARAFPPWIAKFAAAWTSDLRPRCGILSKFLKRPVTAAERDAEWNPSWLDDPGDDAELLRQLDLPADRRVHRALREGA